MDITSLSLIAAAIVLPTLAVVLFLIFRPLKKSKSVKPISEPLVSKEEPSVPKATEKPILDTQILKAKKRELMTMSMGSERVYKNNLDIARKDFAQRGIYDYSEIELHTRAIEIWREDNRR